MKEVAFVWETQLLLQVSFSQELSTRGGLEVLFPNDLDNTSLIWDPFMPHKVHHFIHSFFNQNPLRHHWGVRGRPSKPSRVLRELSCGDTPTSWPELGF